MTAVPHFRPLAIVLLGAFVLGGCYSLAEPSFRPGDQRDIYNSIARRGLIVSEPLAGETACGKPELIANTTYLTARMPDETEPRDVYIHVYRTKNWDGSIEEVDACEAIYAAANPNSEIVRIDVPTYRVFGADWSTELTEELRAAFEESSQAG